MARITRLLLVGRTSPQSNKIGFELLHGVEIHVIHAVPYPLEYAHILGKHSQQFRLGASFAPEFARIILVRLAAMDCNEGPIRQIREARHIECTQRETPLLTR